MWMPKTKVRFFLSEPSANFSDPRACLKIKALFKIHVFFFFFFSHHLLQVKSHGPEDKGKILIEI